MQNLLSQVPHLPLGAFQAESEEECRSKTLGRKATPVLQSRITGTETPRVVPIRKRASKRERRRGRRSPALVKNRIALLVKNRTFSRCSHRSFWGSSGEKNGQPLSSRAESSRSNFIWLFEQKHQRNLREDSTLASSYRCQGQTRAVQSLERLLPAGV